MKPLLRLLVVSLLIVSGFVGIARAGDGTEPLCTPSRTNAGCVITNWGVISPDSPDANANAPSPSTEDGRTASGTGAVHAISVATMRSADERTIKSLVSPVGLFTTETKELVAALQGARFKRDGTIAMGESRIAAVAGDIARKAAGKYMLTIYIKVPQTIRADESKSLSKKVQAINAVLSSTTGQ